MALGPRWFLGVDVLFDIFFLAVTLIVAIIALRAHRFFKEGKYFHLGVGFALLALNYLILAITNFLVFAREGEVEFAFERLMNLQVVIAHAHDLRAILFLLALTVLALLYLRIPDLWAKSLIVLLVLFGFALSGDAGSMFYVLASLLLLAIIVKLGESYLRHPSKYALLVLLGFLGILVGRVLLSVLFVSPVLYVVAHIITLAGYSSILASQVVR